MQKKFRQDPLAWTQFFPYVLIRLGGMPIQTLEAFRFSALAIDLQELKEAQVQVGNDRKHLQETLDRAISQSNPSRLRTALYNIRERFFKHKNVIWERVLPDLNADGGGWSTQLTQAIWDWEHSDAQLRYKQGVFEKNYARSLEQSFAQLKDHLSPAFLQGLSAASASLTERALAFIEKPKTPKNNKKNRQTALGLWQFLARASSKTSPLGAFGPIAFLDIEHWPTELPPFSIDKIKAAPNIALLDFFYAILEENGKLHYESPISLSPSVCETDEAFVFLAYREGVEKLHQLEKNETLSYIVDLLKEPQRFKYIAKRISKLTSVPKLECIDFVQNLSNIGFLDWEKPIKGFSPNWAYQLLEFLAFLPEEFAQPAPMGLLRHLHNTAKTYPHMSPKQRLDAQQSTAKKIDTFCADQDFEAMDFPPNAFFYEDKVVDALADFSAEELTPLIEALQETFQTMWRFPLSRKQSLATSFFLHHFAPNDTPPFLVFVEKLLRDPEILKAEAEAGFGFSVENMPIGVVIQPFRLENGALSAVLNGLHFGGGKMSNRFLPLLPEAFKQTLINWNQLNDGLSSAEMAWSSTSNSNFHSATASCALYLPDGHPASEVVVPLHQISVRLNPTFGDFVELFDTKSGLTLLILDNTPEASDSYPPVMQWLRALGMPFVSSQIFKKKTKKTKKKETLLIEKTERQFLQDTSIVLHRTTWRISIEAFSKETNARFLKDLYDFFQENNIPQQVFFYKKGAKPQFLDCANPFSVLHFEKFLRKQNGCIVLEETLPAPEQSLFSSAIGRHAGELALEFRI